MTLDVPNKPDLWNLFFESLERAFETKSVPENLKAEILLNLLGDKSANVLIYISKEEIQDYEKIKSLVLKENEPTARDCLENFRKATRN